MSQPAQPGATAETAGPACLVSLEPGTYERATDWEGNPRGYRLHVPPVAPGLSPRLILSFAGEGVPVCRGSHNTQARKARTVEWNDGRNSRDDEQSRSSAEK